MFGVRVYQCSCLSCSTMSDLLRQICELQFKLHHSTECDCLFNLLCDEHHSPSIQTPSLTGVKLVRSSLSVLFRLPSIQTPSLTGVKLADSMCFFSHSFILQFKVLVFQE